MKFELIRTPEQLEYYGDIPCLPVEFKAWQGMRFVGEESDAKLLVEHFIPELDKRCDNVLDQGDVEYFDVSRCPVLKEIIKRQKNRQKPARLLELYRVLEGFVDEAIRLGTGVVIEL